jgi:hypothetical protein
MVACLDYEAEPVPATAKQPSFVMLGHVTRDGEEIAVVAPRQLANCRAKKKHLQIFIYRFDGEAADHNGGAQRSIFVVTAKAILPDAQKALSAAHDGERFYWLTSAKLVGHGSHFFRFGPRLWSIKEMCGEIIRKSEGEVAK